MLSGLSPLPDKEATGKIRGHLLTRAIPGIVAVHEDRYEPQAPVLQKFVPFGGEGGPIKATTGIPSA
jgi:hypothetical protein